MNWELHAIQRPCRRVPGALKRLVLIDPDDLSEQPTWGIFQNIEDLVFNSGKAAYAFEADRFTGQLVGDTDVNNAAGDSTNYTLTGFFRNIRLDFEFLRAKLRNRRIHVVGTYWNGTQRYVPYMRMRFKDDSGDKLSARNGYALTGNTSLITPAPLINAALTVVYPDGTVVTPPSSSSGGVSTFVDTTSDTSYTYSLPPGKWLVGVYVRSDEAQTVRLGTSPGAEDLGGTLSGDANDQLIFQCNNFRPLVATNIYLTGLEGLNTIEIWYIG